MKRFTFAATRVAALAVALAAAFILLFALVGCAALDSQDDRGKQLTVSETQFNGRTGSRSAKRLNASIDVGSMPAGLPQERSRKPRERLDARDGGYRNRRSSGISSVDGVDSQVARQEVTPLPPLCAA